jgi:MFS family permease
MVPSARSVTRRNLRSIFVEGVAFSVMVGVGEAYVPAFALAIGVKVVWAGLLITVPLFAGGLLQLASPIGVSRLRSRRRWVVGCAVIQGLSFVPLIGAAVVGHVPTWLLFLITSVYWGAGLAAGPPWNAWVGTLVPRRIRTRYFAKRNAACHLGVFAGVLSAGLFLEHSARAERTLVGFIVLFALAGVCRLVSAAFLARQTEPSPPLAGEQRLPVARLAKRLGRGTEWKLLRYQIALAAAVAIAVPFFTPFMLKEMHLRYHAYMTLMAASLAAKIVVMSLAGNLAERWGTGKLLRLAALAIAPLSSLWLVSDSFGYLLVLQLAAGALWASHDLAAFLLMLDTIREDERTSVLTFYNFANAAATAGGSILGGVLFEALGSGGNAYKGVFVGSTLARVGALALLVGITTSSLPRVRLMLRTIAVRPDLGGISRPIVATVRRRRRFAGGRGRDDRRSTSPRNEE